jgi:hypothetical protein
MPWASRSADARDHRPISRLTVAVRIGEALRGQPRPKQRHRYVLPTQKVTVDVVTDNPASGCCTVITPITEKQAWVLGAPDTLLDPSSAVAQQAEQAGPRGPQSRDLGMPAGYDRDRHRLPEGANQANVDSRSGSGPNRKRGP